MNIVGKAICILLALSLTAPAVVLADTDRADGSKLISHEEAELRRQLINNKESAIYISENVSDNVIYIETAEDLLAIDGESDGYYELKDNIDLSGISWIPIDLYNATINGAGYSITGLTLDRVYENEYGENNAGMFAGYGIYIADLSISEAKADISLSGSDNEYENYQISVTGDVYLDHCMIDADINVVGASDNMSLNVLGISSGNDTVFNGDINVVNGSVKAMVGSVRGCEFIGDISSEGEYFNAYGIETYETAENCAIYGDITADGVAVGISGPAESCRFYGDITGGSAVGCLNNLSDCIVTGDITAVSGHAHGIENSTGCVVEGDITGFDAYGIYGQSSDCSVYGSIASKTDGYGSAAGIYITGIGAGCSVYGDVTAYSGGALGITAFEAWQDGERISGSVYSSAVYGNISGSDSARGMYIYNGELKNCTVYGNITSGGETVGIISSGAVKSCSVYGDISVNENAAGEAVTAAGIRAYQEYGATEGCIIKGNITSPYTALGIEGAQNSCLYGSVTGGRVDFGMSESSGCYISGSIAEQSEDSPLTVSASVPYQACYRCNECGSELLSAQDMGERYKCGCTSYSYYYRVNELCYDSGSRPEMGTEVTPAPEMTAPPMGPCIITVLDYETSEPIAWAELKLDGKKYITNENGVVVSDRSGVIAGLSVSIGGNIIHTETNYVAAAGHLNTVYVNGLDLEAEDFNFGNGGEASVTGPQISIMGKQFSLFELPVSFEKNYMDIISLAYDKENKEYQAIIGMAYDKESIVNNDAKNPTWRKQFDSIVGFFREASTNGFTDELIKSFNNTELSPKPRFGRLAVDGQVRVSGFLKLKPAKDDIAVEGGVIMTGQMSGSTSIPWPLCPALYAAFSITGTVGTSLSFEPTNISIKDPQFDVKGNINMGLTPAVGVGAGLKGMLGVEAGLQGTLEASVDFPFETAEKSLKVTLSGGYYVMSYCLGREYRVSDKLASLQLYPDKDEIKIAEVSEEDFDDVDRSYLELVGAGEYDGYTYKTGVYPYADVKTVRLSGERVLMVWLDDDAQREDSNRTALYYSIYSDGTWSEAAQISSDGTADYSFALASNGNRAYVTWQNAVTQLSGDESLDDIAAGTQLMISGFDGDIWSEPEKVTDEGVYAYDPHIQSSGDNVYVMWTQNSGNKAVAGDSETESIHMSAYYNGVLQSEAEEKVSGLVPGSQGALNSSGETAVVDSNGKILYIDGVQKYTANGKITGLSSLDSEFYFVDSGELKKISSFTGAQKLCSGIGEYPVIIEAGEDYAAVYRQQDGFRADLYAVYISRDGSCTAPVPVLKSEKMIRSFCPAADDDGNISAAAVVINAGENDTTEIPELIYTETAPIEDIAVEAISVSDTIELNKMADFTVSVTNRTKSVLTDVYLTISGEDCGELYSSNIKTRIEPGETEKVKALVKIPDNFVKQTVTAEVTSAAVEQNTGNNSISDIFGGADLSVELRGKELTVRNIGTDAANGVELKANENVLIDQKIGVLEAGEKYSVMLESEDDVTVEAVSSSDEQYLYNNTCSGSTKDRVLLIASDKRVGVAPGEKYSLRVDSSSDEDVPVYFVSSDETVAAVDENGTVTAVSEGAAAVEIISPNALTRSVVMIYVREKRSPEIISAELNDYGELKLRLDTSECMASGESGELIVAVYDEDGALIAVEKKATSGQECDLSMYINGGYPAKVKAMVWNSINGMYPSSYAAEENI